MSAAVEIRSLAYAYHDGTPALRGIDLRVERGEKVGIIGPNGAGKSTLLLHLNGSLLPDGGSSVLIEGLKAEGSTLERIRRLVGLVFQDPEDQLFCPTVFEDVAFGPANAGLRGEELRRKVREALDAVGIPAGMDHRLAHHASYGEKKRIAIATVLSMDVEILALDEPTSNLDPAGRRALIGLLKSFPHTTIVATHDLEMAREVCARVVLLDRGLLEAEGPTDGILGDEALMEAHGLEVPLSLKLGAR
jgi:cobalt/nickel transport system ATP-binding protein